MQPKTAKRRSAFRRANRTMPRRRIDIATEAIDYKNPDLLKKFVTEPQVTIIVTAINSQRVYILGEVTRAGAYPLLPNMTVLQALSHGGGFSQYANLKKIYVLRVENGKQEKHSFNYKDVVAGKAADQNIFLKAGDTIVVP